jgi:hypothetical protein
MYEGCKARSAVTKMSSAQGWLGTSIPSVGESSAGPTARTKKTQQRSLTAMFPAHSCQLGIELVAEPVQEKTPNFLSIFFPDPAVRTLRPANPHATRKIEHSQPLACVVIFKSLLAFACFCRKTLARFQTARLEAVTTSVCLDGHPDLQSSHLVPFLHAREEMHAHQFGFQAGRWIAWLSQLAWI